MDMNLDNMAKLLEKMTFEDADLTALATNAVDYAKDVAAHGDTAFLPIAHVVCIPLNDCDKRENVCVAFADLPDNSDDRAKAFAGLGASLVEQGLLPLAIVFSSEAWMSVVKAEDDDGNPITPEITGRPSEDPNRIEIHAVTGMTSQRRSVVAFHEMRRKTDNTIVLVEYGKDNLVVSNGSTGESRLLHSFFAGTKDAVMRRMLQSLLKGCDDEPATDDEG